MMKKLLTVFFALTMMMSTIVFTPSIVASAVTDDKLSAEINLQVGTLTGSVFTPLDSGTALKTNDYVTVRICPKTDFYCGSTSYVVVFDKLYFSVSGANKAAFTANTNNTFYDQTASGFSGTTTLPDSSWPPTMGSSENYSVYQAIRVGNQADSNSNNGGYPSLLPGTWLFQFKLKVLKDTTLGTTAKILMDKRWFRTPSYTTGTAYFAKCATSTQLSSSGSSTTYDFNITINNIYFVPETTTTTSSTTTTTHNSTTTNTTSTTAAATTTTPGATTTKSGATTTKHTVTTTKQGATTTKHTVTTTKHGTTTTKPAVTTTKRGTTTTKPIGTTAKPTGTDTTAPTLVNGTTGNGSTDLDNTTASGTITTTSATNNESTTKAADDSGNNINARRTGIIVVLIAVLATLAGVIAYLIKKKK